MLGSIGVLAETSDMQREAFNRAFAEADLDWRWTDEQYTALLERPGGLRRIEEYNRARGAHIDARAIHRRKTEIFNAALKDGVPLRPGVSDVVEAAWKAGVPVAVCSTTSPDTVELILARGRPGLPAGAIGFDGTRVADLRPKPAPDIWHAALDALGVPASRAVAVEDSPENAAAAREAGLRVVAFPGARHAHRAFPGAERIVTRLTPEALGLAEGPVPAG
ncbi:HAD-IA family hydrolase [Hasllibacter halocynthiae]|uniref:HAD-IA family hydrolase n=1 Tax=Hasllibacter halocynthiae TaxID=595589 RepID=UPI001304D02E|nr:HAD-IA family hydrolase [Hasllibacter halocynthiae]